MQTRLGDGWLEAPPFLAAKGYPEKIFAEIEADVALVAQAEDNGWNRGPLSQEIIARLTIGPDWQKRLEI